MPIGGWRILNSNGKKAHYIQINHLLRQLSSNKKILEEAIKGADFEFLPDMKTLISGTAIDPALTGVQASMRREDRETTTDEYRPVFDKLSISKGLIYMDDRIVVSVNQLRRLLDILHFGHAGTTKMTAKAKSFFVTGDQQRKR